MLSFERHGLNDEHFQVLNVYCVAVASGGQRESAPVANQRSGGVCEDQERWKMGRNFLK